MIEEIEKKEKISAKNIEVILEDEDDDIEEYEEIESKKESPAAFPLSFIYRQNNKENAFTIVNGQVLDITKFLHKHPGGEMIRLAVGRDSSALFASHHPEPSYAKNFLNKYCVGEVFHSGEGYPRYSFDSDFYKTLKNRVYGLFGGENKKTIHINQIWLYLKIIICMMLFLYTYWMGFIIGNICYSIISSFIICWLSFGLCHAGHHGSTSSNPFINKMCCYFGDFFLGMSSFSWSMEHNLFHHRSFNFEVQFIQNDESPIVFLRQNSREEYKWYHKYQPFYCWFLYLTTNSRWFLSDWMFLLLGEYRGEPFIELDQREQKIFYISKVFFIFYTFFLPSFFHDIGYTFLLTIIFQVVCSFLYFMLFVVNRINIDVLPMDYYSKLYNEHDWATVQIMSSVTYQPSLPWIVSFFFHGLNYQTEHNLFPSIDHSYYPEISKIVKSTCDEFGVQYNSRPTYLHSLINHIIEIVKLSKLHKD